MTRPHYADIRPRRAARDISALMPRSAAYRYRPASASPLCGFAPPPAGLLSGGALRRLGALRYTLRRLGCASCGLCAATPSRALCAPQGYAAFVVPRRFCVSRAGVSRPARKCPAIVRAAMRLCCTPPQSYPAPLPSLRSASPPTAARFARGASPPPPLDGRAAYLYGGAA